MNTWLAGTVGIVAAIGVALAVLTQQTAGAGLHTDTKTPGWNSVGNVQTMQLLAGSNSPAPTAMNRGGGGVAVTGNALRAQVGPSGSSADMSAQSGGDQISVYVVREGDSLSQVAEMFDVSVNTIVWANDIEHGDLIRPGQTLAILPVSGVRHTVEEDDTIKDIAEHYNGSAEEIISYNNLDTDTALSVGDEVIVPNGEVPSPTPHTKQNYARTRQPVDTSTHAARGYYIQPVRGAVVTQGLHGYNAVDFGVARGTPVVAAADGEVIIVRNGGWSGGYGKYIVVRHNNGTQTLYAHQSRNIVHVGQSVVQGQVIGYVGSTGRSTGPHVHFEVRGATNPFR